MSFVVANGVWLWSVVVVVVLLVVVVVVLETDI